MDLFDDRLYYCHSCYCCIIFCLLLCLDWNAWIIPSHAVHRLFDGVFFLIFNLCNPMVQVSDAKVQRFLKMYGPRFFSYFPAFLVYDKHCYLCVFGYSAKKIVCLVGFYDILNFLFLGCLMMNAMIKISKSDLVILLLLEHWILLQCGCTYSF